MNFENKQSMSKILIYHFFILNFFLTPIACSNEWLSYYNNEEKVLDLRITASVDGVGKLNTIPGALEVKTTHGWKIYWKNPGGPGLPPKIKLENSKNIKNIFFFWPSPKRFSFQGIDNFGYEGEIFFPLNISLVNISQEVSFKSKIIILACKNICIPIEKEYNFYLPNAPSKVNYNARKRAEYLSLVPEKIEPHNIQVGKIELEENLLKINDTKFQTLNFDIFFEELSGFNFGKPFIKNSDVFIPIFSEFNYEDLIGKELKISFVSKEFNFEVLKKIYKGNKKKVSTFNNNIFFLLIAFFGGFILNFMPCVLPILAMKLTSILNKRSEDRKRIRLGFFFTIIGIISSFSILSLIFISLRSLGYQINWGIQFQQPVFLIFMSLTILFFSLNMFGFFEISLPQNIRKIFAKNYSGYFGDFFNGFATTILSTPCSAPFVGTAITFAFTSSNMLMLLSFVLMGVGLSIPWLIIAIFPNIIAFFPRPGKWMQNLKIILGFGLLLTSAWLFWLFYGFINVETNKFKNSSTFPVITWEKNLHNKFLEKGKTVLVDVTADWCITCKINKTFVLQSERISKLINQGDLIFISADWTLPNNEILTYISSFNRFGIPFNVIYGPSNENGIILPEILSTEKILSTIKQISF